MNAKLILATLAGGIFYFFAGWLVYGILLMDFYSAHTVQYEGLMKEMPNLPVLFLSQLVSAFMLAFIFQKWAGISGFTGGLKGGLIIGLLICLAYDLSFISMMNLYDVTAMAVDVITGSLMTGLMGGCVGWVLGYGKKE